MWSCKSHHLCTHGTFLIAGTSSDTRKVSAWMSMRLSIRTGVSVCVCAFVCARLYLCVCVCACTCVRVFARVCVSIYLRLRHPFPIHPSLTQHGTTQTHTCFAPGERLCMTGLSAKHTVIADNRTIKAIRFDTSKQGNRLDNKPGGKRKKGAHTLQANETIAVIECEDGTAHPVVRYDH